MLVGITVVGIGFLSFVGGAKISGADEFKIYIPDKGIRANVVDDIGRDEENDIKNQLFNINMLRDVTSSIYANTDVPSIEGVQHLENVEKIFFEQNEDLTSVQDLRPLAGMKNLNDIFSYQYQSEIEEPFLLDISPLKELEKIRTITWNKAFILDLTPLEKSIENAVYNKESYHYTIGNTGGQDMAHSLEMPPLSVPKDGGKFEIKLPIKLPKQLEDFSGDMGSIKSEVYISNERIHNNDERYELEDKAIKMPSKIENGILEISGLSEHKSKESYLYVYVSILNGMEIVDQYEIGQLEYGIELYYPIHFY